MNYLDTESWEEQEFAEASIELTLFKEHLEEELLKTCKDNNGNTLSLNDVLEIIENIYSEHIVRLAEE